MLYVDTFTSALVRIARLVSRGFLWHTQGVIPLDKIESVIRKFEDAYGVDADDTKDRSRRRHLQACTRITLWPEGEGLGFVLTVSNGSGLIRERERLGDARNSHTRLIVRDYELAHLPRPGDHPRWTWRLEMDRYRQLMKTGVRLARRQSAESALRLQDQLLRRPMFNGMRFQAKVVLKAMRKERRQAGFVPLPKPECVPWISATFRKAEPLEQWLAKERYRRSLLDIEVTHPEIHTHEDLPTASGLIESPATVDKSRDCFTNPGVAANSSVPLE